MKKIIFLLFVLLPLLNSCSSDDSGVNEPTMTTNGTILKRQMMTFDDEIAILDFFYNGNKLEKVFGNGILYEYTYTGNLITQQRTYQGDILGLTENYTYNSDGNITQIMGLRHLNNTAYREQFIYNGDGTINYAVYSGDFTVQNVLEASKKVYLYPNGDVERMDNYLVVSGTNVTRTNYYTYDTKNAHNNGILGYNKIKHWQFSNSANSHNPITVTYTSTEPSFTPYTDNISFTYNSFNYPITQDIGGAHYQYFYLPN